MTKPQAALLARMVADDLYCPVGREMLPARALHDAGYLGFDPRTGYYVSALGFAYIGAKPVGA